jgi:acyl carrier protein
MKNDEAELIEALAPLLSAVVDDADARDLSPDAMLHLRSIEVITLVDLLEATFEIVFTSDDVHPDNFATPRALMGLLTRKGARCA